MIIQRQIYYHWGYGGKNIYKREYTKFTDEELIEDFFTDNIITASIGYDFMKYLDEHMENYQELIENMKKSSYGEYLKKYLECDVAHKYGSYNGYIHDYGIVYGETTYLIGVYTKYVPNASELIATISKEIFELLCT